jgi:hypothetical protein
MNPSPVARSKHSLLGQIATALACTVGATNLALSVLALAQGVPFVWAVATSGLPVSAEILGVLGLQCAVAHPIGLFIAWISKTQSRATSLLSVALLSLVSSWIALFNIQVFLAPSFTFTVGPVVMTNSYIAVVFAYTACAFVSFGFIFLNMRLSRAGQAARRNAEDGLSAEEFSMVASGVQGLIFVALGMMAGI